MGLEHFSEKTRAWFREAFGEPTLVEDMGWDAVAEGHDVLVSAPTGTGKTLTAFLFWLDTLAREYEAGCLPDGVSVIYISPLKSLSRDIEENLAHPISGLGLSGVVTTAVRTGDTPQKYRQKMRKDPPHVLVTTPESLYVLLTSASGRKMLGGARCVIVDELHSLIGSKRGTHLMLSLERLDALCGRRLQRIALSATIAPLSLAAEYIAPGRECRVIAPEIEKKLDIRVELPWGDSVHHAGPSVWPYAADAAYEASRAVPATLAFTNGRAMAEKLAHRVNLRAEEEWALTHHGCVSKEQRLLAEERLRKGELRMMVATSSMELGIDVGDIDLVLQVTSPLSVSQTLQRAGRAGHGPGRVSRMRVYALSAGDALASCLAVTGAMEGKIERVSPPEMCLDVLAQHLASMAAEGEYTEEEALAIARGAWAYRNLTVEDLRSCLRLLAGDFEHEREIPVRARVLYDRIHGTVRGDEYTRLLALSSPGTIPDRGWYQAVTADGIHLGELDEEFVYEAKIGDKFLLGAFAWQIDEITHDRVRVSRSTADGAQTPFWRGDAVGRNVETGRYYGRLYTELEEAARKGDLSRALEQKWLAPSAAKAAEQYADEEIASVGCLPTDRLIVVEHFTDHTGIPQVMVHSVFGRRVNRGLLMLMRAKAASLTGREVRGYDDDDGILLCPVGDGALPHGLLQGIDPDTAEEKICAMLPGEPMFAMSFRYASARALVMGGGRRGRTPLWVQRLRGAEALSFAMGQKDHPMVREAIRECRDDLLDLSATVEVLRDIASGRIAVREVMTDVPSPMTMPLRRQVEAELMYESPVPAPVRRAAEAAGQAISPDADILEATLRRVESKEALHALLLREGDLAPGDTDAPYEWFLELERQSRAQHIPSGVWIASEQRAEYERALEEGEGDALDRIVRRAMRFRGVLDAPALSNRYLIPEADAGASISRLLASGMIRQVDGGYVHRDAFEFAARATVRRRRQEIVTAPGRRLQNLMISKMRQPGAAKEQLRRALAALSGREFDAEAWESAILPARVPGYRPQMLDEVLLDGEYLPVVRREGKLKLAFIPESEVDYEAWQEPREALTDGESAILSCLEASGALFARAIGAKCAMADPMPCLLSLFEKGLVRQDGFAPVRTLITGKVFASAGRWSRVNAGRALTTDEKLGRAFSACPVLSRETVTGMSWSEAIDRLRVLEFQGTVRRGYFVEGLSGAQFVRAEDFSSVTAFLARDGDEVCCIPANDPGQIYGRAIPHEPGRGFMLVPGTAVGFVGGRCAYVLERRGEVLRLFEPLSDESAAELARAFRRGAIFSARSRIVIKAIEEEDKESRPDEARQALIRAGFTREALDLVLWRT